MDAKKRRALIEALGGSTNFDSNYSEPNRVWFLGKLIDVLEAEGLADSAIEQKTREVVQKAKTVVTTNRDFALALAAAGNTRYTKRALASMRPHRVEILYGAIAFNREFVEPPHLNYLLFIAKRRFRSICRMYFWVNPNKQGYFRYPYRCPSDQRWRVNEDAEPFWELKSPPRDIPIKQKPTVDPVTAIDKLFVKQTDACKGNLFDCAVVADIMFVDSLLEAKDPTRFLNALPQTYLEINHFDHSSFAQSPSDVKNVLSRVAIAMPPRDFQVGDHCYIYNHPLYKTFRPTGSWTGEFSFVYISGDRDHRSQEGFVFGGHGKNGTLYQFYSDFVAELTSYLTLARRLAAAHLAFMRSGAAAIAPGTVSETEDDIKVFDVIANVFKPAARHRLLEYDKTVAARDFTKVPTKTNPKPKSTLSSFLIVQSKTEHVFYLAKVDAPDENKPLHKNLKKKAAELLPSKEMRYPIKFSRLPGAPSGAASQIYAPRWWGVAYTDQATSKETNWPFYEIRDGELQRKELKNKKDELNPELFDSPFFLFNSKGTDIEVYQPKVDFGAHYTFLMSNDAF